MIVYFYTFAKEGVFSYVDFFQTVERASIIYEAIFFKYQSPFIYHYA